MATAFKVEVAVPGRKRAGTAEHPLEVVDHGHPAAFDRMLDLVLDHDLLRFAATIRAVGLWLGFQADVEHMICIIPVDGQRRGRIILLFADDDPKTAEVVSTVLLPARDREIRDPTILTQMQS